MLSIEERLIERWPQWLAGAPGRLTRPLLKGLKCYTRLNAAEQILEALPLILVDLARIHARKRARYLEAADAKLSVAE